MSDCPTFSDVKYLGQSTPVFPLQRSLFVVLAAIDIIIILMNGSQHWLHSRIKSPL